MILIFSFNESDLEKIIHACCHSNMRNENGKLFFLTYWKTFNKTLYLQMGLFIFLQLLKKTIFNFSLREVIVSNPQEIKMLGSIKTFNFLCDKLRIFSGMKYELFKICFGTFFLELKKISVFFFICLRTMLNNLYGRIFVLTFF